MLDRTMRVVIRLWKSGPPAQRAVELGGLLALVTICAICNYFSTFLGSENAPEPETLATPAIASARPTPPYPPTFTPTPTPTPLPTPTSTRVLNNNVSPTPTPSPTFTPTSTRTPPFQLSTTAPTATPTPTATLAVPIFQEALVTHVVDGQTIEVLINGQEFRVRYLSVDAPEIKDPPNTPEPYGWQAFEVNRVFVEGQIVLLEKDVREKDRFGQLLRYVYLDELMINAELLKRGLAKFELMSPDTKYQDQLLKAQEQAQQAQVGIWSRNKPIVVATETPITLASSTSGQLVIVVVDHSDEFVEIQNQGVESINLSGWTLVSENGSERCRLSGILQPDRILRVWALAADADKQGYHCQFRNNIWSNAEPDPAVLYNPAGEAVSRLE